MSAFSIITLALVSAMVVLYLKRRCWWLNKISKNVLRPPGITLPLIGDVYRVLYAPNGILNRVLEYIYDMELDKTLKPVLLWVGENAGVLVFRPEDVEVMLAHTKEVSKPRFGYEFAISFFGNGLITLNGDSWQYHRKVLTPVFHFKILERYVDVFQRRAQVLVKEFSDPRLKGLDIDVLPYMTRTTAHTICETAFGMSEKLASRDEIRKRDDFLKATAMGFEIIKMRIIRPWLTVPAIFRFSRHFAMQKKAEEVIKKYALRIIRMKKEEIEEEDEEIRTADDDIGAKKKVAFLDLVLRDSKNVLSEDEILQEVRTLITVQQTTATTMSFILVMLAVHQDVQEKVFQEIQELDARSDDRSTYERLGELKYLERVIKETLRLYPATPLFFRQLNEDLTFSNFTLPAGCIVSMFLFLTHRDRRFYGPDPDRFDPDHFLPERCHTRHPFAYVPFSAGPRNCIGQKYAMLQMKAVVSSIIRNVRLLPGKGCETQEDISLEMDTFLFIQGGFNVRVEPRN